MAFEADRNNNSIEHRPHSSSSSERPQPPPAEKAFSVSASNSQSGATEAGAANVLWECSENEGRHPRFTLTADDDDNRVRSGSYEPVLLRRLFSAAAASNRRGCNTITHHQRDDASQFKRQPFPRRNARAEAAAAAVNAVSSQQMKRGERLRKRSPKRPPPWRRRWRSSHLYANIKARKRRFHHTSKNKDRPKAFIKTAARTSANEDWLVNDISGEPDKTSTGSETEVAPFVLSPPNIIEDDIATDIEEVFSNSIRINFRNWFWKIETKLSYSFNSFSALLSWLCVCARLR